MAYIIQFNFLASYHHGYAVQNKILEAFKSTIVNDGKFKASFVPFTDNKNQLCIKVQKVRLVKAKPYCGAHPGPCVLAGKKPTATYLEWDDWVKFNRFINRVLNKFHINANVWSEPHDVKGKMWIRKGLKMRKRYDWTEEFNSYGQPVRTWNQGTEDQF